MYPARIRGTNFTYTAPKSAPECQDLHVRVENDPIMGRSIVSAWTPSPEEAKRIASGQPIYLRVFGAGHPVVALTVPIDDDTA